MTEKIKKLLLFSLFICCIFAAGLFSVSALHEHKTEAVEEKPPSCLEEGNSAYFYCEICNLFFSDEAGDCVIERESTVISPTGIHTPVSVTAKSPTCAVSGCTGYYRCSQCGLLFSNKDCTEQINKTDTVIPATGNHTPIVDTIPASTKKSGKIVTYCSECASVIKTVKLYPVSAQLSSTEVFYNGKERTPKVTVKNSKGTTVKSDCYTVSRPKSMKLPGTYKITVRFSGRYTGSQTLKFKIKTPVPVLNSLKTDDSQVTVSWSKVKGASGYRLYMSETKTGGYKKIKDTSLTSYTKKGLVNGKKYYFKLKAYIKDGSSKRHYSASTAAKSIKVRKAVKITLNKTALTMNVGTVITLKPYTYPSGVKIKWTSSDKSVASVTKAGKIYALEKGKSVITASFTYKDVKYKATCTVKVSGKYSYDMNGEKFALINPENGGKWYLTVVNRSRRVSENYLPELSGILTSIYYDQELDSRVAPYYEKMYYAARKDGITLAPYSAFRYYSGQKRNYLNRISLWQSYGYSKAEAIEKTVEVIMAPGGSEHNLGLAVDINGTNYDFDQTAAYRWLAANAYKYGFIQRYPAGKSNITGVVCEPWHWRYVGKTAAKEMLGTGLCLEEYLDMKGIAY